MAIGPFSAFGACPLSVNGQPTPSADVPRKPRRRWLRFSLRTLLVLVTLLSIGLGWFVHRGERQRRAVAALKKMGIRVYYEDKGSPPASKSFDWSRWLPRDYVDDVYSVELSLYGNGDADLANLLLLTRLKNLTLFGKEVTDAELAQIQRLTRLEMLRLWATQATDAGLSHVGG